MFKEVTYDRLLAITNTVKPYRHTSRSKKPKGSYPVIPDLRHHTHKYFAQNKDGSFTIYYYGGEIVHVHKGNIVGYIFWIVAVNCFYLCFHFNCFFG